MDSEAQRRRFQISFPRSASKLLTLELMWDEISLSPSERREQRLLYVQDPSYDIIAYPERNCYWLQTRLLELTGGNWDYEKRVPADVDKIISNLLGVKCPDWLDDANSIRQHYSTYRPEIDKCPEHIIIKLVYNILSKLPGWDPATTNESIDEVIISSFVASALAFFQKLQIRCRGRSRPKLWSILYSSFFESIWDEEFHENGISVEYGPIWALHETRSTSVPLNHAFERLRITPDVVFSIFVPAITPDDHLNASYSDMVNPEMNISFDALYGPGRRVHLPMLIVEYVTTPGLEGTDADRLEGLDQHEMHLAMSMMSASGLYKAIGISYPVFGLLVHKFVIEVFAHLALSPKKGGEEKKECVAGLGYVKPQAKFDLKNVSDAVRFRMFLHNLVGHATKLRDSAAVARPALLKSIENSTYHRWKLTELPERPKSPIDPPAIADWARNIES